MQRVGEYGDGLREHRLDVGNRYAVLAALAAIAVIPVEAGDLDL
jgi:hypothetical protein